MADDTPTLPNQTFIQSREPAKNGYGQNGYQGASSDLPGKKTNTDPKASVSIAQVEVPTSNSQTRDVSTLGKHAGQAPIPVHSGTKGAAQGPKIGPAAVNPPKKN